MTSRSKIVAVAKSYIGTCGGSAAHADILHYFNSVKPFGYTAHKSDPWCAIFVSACAIQAFGKTAAKKYFPLSAACTYMINKGKELNIFIESDKYIPEAGDFILYDWDDTGRGDNKGQPDHVGIVEYYKAGYIHVIEGNMGSGSGKCGRRKLRIDGRYIRGFIAPDYDRIRVNKEKTNEEIAKEVIAGKWGNGLERKERLTAAGYDYKKIQAIVNKLMKRG